MKKLFLVYLLLSCLMITAQDEPDPASPQVPEISVGWADDAVSIGYITAPSVLCLMFISALVSEWNAGYFGIPASAMILAAPPVIYMGGRSATVDRGIFQSRARLGWTLYALSIIPTSVALYGFTTDWGATLPLTVASGVLGTASIVAMSTYAYGRSAAATQMINASARGTLNFGIVPLRGGAMASFTYRF